MSKDDRTPGDQNGPSDPKTGEQPQHDAERKADRPDEKIPPLQDDIEAAILGLLKEAEVPYRKRVELEPNEDIRTHLLWALNDPRSIISNRPRRGLFRRTIIDETMKQFPREDESCIAQVLDDWDNDKKGHVVDTDERESGRTGLHIIRIGPEGLEKLEQRDDNGANHPSQKTPSRKRNSKSKLLKQAKRDIVLAFLKKRYDWEGTLRELSRALEREKHLVISAPTLWRYLRGTKYMPRGNPHRPATVPGKRTHETEPVADEGPDDLSEAVAFTMPDDE